MDTAKFTHKNESFICDNCGATVLPTSGSCRNHCPFCLFSRHLDVFPGDRQANCGALMEPIEVLYHSKKGYQIVHRCTACQHQSRNVLRLEDDSQPDAYDIVLSLMKHSHR